MSNERLRQAMARTGLSIEAAARKTGVDPKTVQRWLSGRVPHPRHRWALCEAVSENEEYLWPGAGSVATAGSSAGAELVAGYAFRSELDPAHWWNLITGADRQIDLLGYTLYFLPQQHPTFVRTLIDACTEGCRVRICIADPAADQVRLRDEEEQEPITIAARISSSLKALEPLFETKGADIRYQRAPLYNSVFRFDDEMLVTPHLYATPGHAAPLMQLRRLGPNGLFSRFSAHFEAIWADSTPVVEDGVRRPVRSGS
jgi:transcriptional regulator with XRE-family HTH domain